MGPEQFGMLHRPDVPIGELEKRIAECARDADPAGIGIDVSSSVTDFTAEVIPPGDLAGGFYIPFDGSVIARNTVLLFRA